MGRGKGICAENTSSVIFFQFSFNLRKKMFLNIPFKMEETCLKFLWVKCCYVCIFFITKRPKRICQYPVFCCTLLSPMPSHTSIKSQGTTSVGALPRKVWAVREALGCWNKRPQRTTSPTIIKNNSNLNLSSEIRPFLKTFQAA